MAKKTNTATSTEQMIPEVQDAAPSDTVNLAEASLVNQGNQNTEGTQVPTDFDAAAYIEKMGSKSAAIRQMAAQGMKRGAIAKALGIRYQHVRNVLLVPVKKKDIPSEAIAIQTTAGAATEE